MPIQSYAGFKKMTEFCKTKVPESIRDRLEAIKDDEQAVKDCGIEIGREMCQRIIDAKVSPGLHFYTLNLEVNPLIYL